MSAADATGDGLRMSVVGTGLMGVGLAKLAAARGVRVTLHGRTAESLERASRALTPDGRVRLTASLDPAGDADVVVEAIAESLPVKRTLFGELGALCRPDTMLASVTSAIPITALAEGMVAPHRMVGMHFFAPVPRTGLCEIVRGAATSAETVDRASALARSLGKEAIVVDRDVAGFVTTRLIVALMLEAARLVESGVSSAEQVDTACRLAFGHPVGPLMLADLSGLDVLLDASTIIYESSGEPGFRPPPILSSLVAKGCLGRKSGRGFHAYSPGGPR
jgi:3-hydroxybutyryl-CoA dehydrogenase